MISEQIISALIGAGSALLVMLIKDFIISLLTQRKERRKQLITQRIEKVYASLDYLLYLFETDDTEKETAREEIKTILKQYGYLLTEKTLSGFYILVDGENTGVFDSDTVERFVQEYRQLREAFYDAYASVQDIDIGRSLAHRKRRRRNHA